MDKRLFLIDGHALIFKMYYAFLRRPMINSKGADMSILFGFTKYILELTEKEKPTHLAIAFDPPGGTFRHELYPEYKGTRAETPQLVIDSLEPLTELCHAMRIPVLMVKGYEADDVIGSMAKKAEKEGFTVFMVTPDKDYGQLISDHIIQYKPGKGGSDCEIIDRKAVCEKYGISDPEQVIEMLTICGDTSDNVPGVKGVGEVGAGKLISKFGTVKNIYAHLDELPARQKEAFEAARDHIELSHTLVTIKTDIPLQTTADEMSVDMEYDPSIADLFEKYEFQSLRKYISHVAAAPSAAPKSNTLQVTETNADKVKEAVRKAGLCGIVTETDGPSIFAAVTRITIGVLSAEGGQAEDGRCSAWTGLAAEGSAEDFRDILEDKNIQKAGYNLKYQSNVLCHAGIEMKGKFLDIELMHYLINPEKSHSIEILAKSYLDIDITDNDKESSQGTLFGQEDGDTGHVQKRKQKEAVVAAMLSGKLAEDLAEHSATDLYDKMEEPLLKVLAQMERSGVKMDFGVLAEYTAALEKEMKEREQKIREMASEPDLNISSPRQIGIVLFEKLALDPKVKAKSGSPHSYPTDEETLSALADKHPIINEILEYRAVKKLLSTYIAPFPGLCSPVTGKIHTTFNQALTATGRLSSSKPNLQNIPIRTDRGREIRKAFVAGTPDGVILSADYSQIELRIMAHLSQDRHLTEAFREGKDVHAITAAKIFKESLEDVTPDQRRIAKTANFGIMYGISAFGLAQRLKIPRTEAKKIIDDYFANFPAVSAYISDILAATREKGYVETLFGRRRYLPDINSRNATVRSLAERNAINAPIQGTSADIIKLAMINVSRRITEAGLGSRMVLQVHDELVFDVPAGEEETLKKIVKEEMENVVSLSVPLTVECNYGKNWLEAH
ncbi:MAG: DNA polymerase I [Bacteroidetes bacterium]|uniref:DNA polymerase I n=1 Tax=Candidatus Cryptobacteroides intestinigallinarum TaxID=2840767 RepID=A0A9D9N0B7_9BACT|nr:DNA polymerase I [Candidatus Cryptobacteroides intestinigallinarum]